MLASRKQAEHACRVSFISRLLENVMVHHDHGIGAQYDFLFSAVNGERLLSREAEHILFSAFAIAPILYYGRSANFKGDARVGQNFAAAWGLRGENQHCCFLFSLK